MRVIRSEGQVQEFRQTAPAMTRAVFLIGNLYSFFTPSRTRGVQFTAADRPGHPDVGLRCTIADCATRMGRRRSL
jgi:hypothetical protein